MPPQARVLPSSPISLSQASAAGSRADRSGSNFFRVTARASWNCTVLAVSEIFKACAAASSNCDGESQARWLARSSKFAPNWRTRVEGICVEIAEGALRDCLDLGREDFGEGGNRIGVRTTGEMPLQQAPGGFALVLARGPCGRKFGELGVGQEGQGAFRQIVLQKPVEVLSFDAEEATIVEVVHRLAFEVEAVDGDRRLSMLLAIADAAGVRQEIAVHLDEAETATRDLLGHMGLDAIEDRQFRDADAVQIFEVFQRHLEEGQLVAFEVLGQREAEHGLGREAECCQNLDPQIDIAIGFRPHAFARMQCMGRVGGRIQSGKDRRRHRVSPRVRRGPRLATGRRPTRGDGTAPARCAPDRSRRRRCVPPSRRRGSDPISSQRHPGDS